MKKLILILFSTSIILLGKPSEAKIIMSYSLSNETIIGYNEYEDHLCYYNVGKFEKGIWDNYLGLIKIKNHEKEKIIVYDDYKVLYYNNINSINNGVYKEITLNKDEKAMLKKVYKQAFLELKEAYIPERIVLFDKITSFSVTRDVEIVELENYGYLTFIPGKYTENGIYNNRKKEIVYRNTEILINYLKDIININ